MEKYCKETGHAVKKEWDTDEVQVTYGNQIRITKAHQIVTEPFRKVQKVVYCISVLCRVMFYNVTIRIRMIMVES